MPMSGPPSPARPGREARRDNEYERCGTANVFCAVEPKAGRHFTFPTPDRSACRVRAGSLRFGRSYPQANTIHLVMDNLNIHRRKSLDRPARRRDRQRSLGPIHRPLHAHSWKLAQSGRNRNRPLLAAMPRKAENPDLKTSPGIARLEPPDEPRPHQNQLEV